MKIVALECYTREVDGIPKSNWRQGLSSPDTEMRDGWLRIVTDEGVDGFGPLLGPWAHINEDLVRRRIAPFAVGRDPLNREQMWADLWELDRVEELPIYSFGLLDVALWDLGGKVAGLPVHRLMGGFRDRIPAYASTATFESIEEYLDVADQCLARGFRSIKLHAWGDWHRDAELARRLREHLGPDIRLMYDGSGGFDLGDSIRLGRVLEELDFDFYEEPMRDMNFTLYQRLCSTLDIPVLATETSDNVHYTSAQFIAHGATDMARIGTTYKGGITGAIRIAHLADAFGMRAEVHSGGLPNINLLAALSNTTAFEVGILTNPIFVSPLVGADAIVDAPTIPGIGWDWDVSTLRGWRVARYEG